MGRRRSGASRHPRPLRRSSSRRGPGRPGGGPAFRVRSPIRRRLRCFASPAVPWSRSSAGRRSWSSGPGRRASAESNAGIRRTGRRIRKPRSFRPRSRSPTPAPTRPPRPPRLRRGRGPAGSPPRPPRVRARPLPAPAPPAPRPGAGPGSCRSPAGSASPPRTGRIPSTAGPPRRSPTGRRDGHDPGRRGPRRDRDSRRGPRRSIPGPCSPVPPSGPTARAGGARRRPRDPFWRAGTRTFRGGSPSARSTGCRFSGMQAGPTPRGSRPGRRRRGSPRRRPARSGAQPGRQTRRARRGRER